MGVERNFYKVLGPEMGQLCHEFRQMEISRLSARLEAKNRHSALTETPYVVDPCHLN